MKKNYLEPRIKVNTISIEAVMLDVSNTPVGGFDVKEEPAELEDFENFFE